MISAPIFLATSVGKLLTNPPSTSKCPSCSPGTKTPGIAILEYKAVGKKPELRITSSPITRSVPIHANETGKSLKFAFLGTLAVSPQNRLMIF